MAIFIDVESSGGSSSVGLYTWTFARSASPVDTDDLLPAMSINKDWPSGITRLDAAWISPKTHRPELLAWISPHLVHDVNVASKSSVLQVLEAQCLDKAAAVRPTSARAVKGEVGIMSSSTCTHHLHG